MPNKALHRLVKPLNALSGGVAIRIAFNKALHSLVKRLNADM